MSLDPADVRRQADAWIWVPVDARHLHTEEFWLVAYPPTAADPCVAYRLDSARPAAELVVDILDAAGALGHTEVTFAGLSDRTRPADLEAFLRDLGAVEQEEVAVLARALPDVPDLAVPGDLAVREVTTLDVRRDLDLIESDVWGTTPLGVDELAESLQQMRASTVSRRFVAYEGLTPLAAAGISLRDGVLSLWGAATLPAARGRGAYRTLLDHRLRLGHAAGARMALVKGRLATSAPVLRRAGFTDFGVERSLHLRPPA